MIEKPGSDQMKGTAPKAGSSTQATVVIRKPCRVVRCTGRPRAVAHISTPTNTVISPEAANTTQSGL